MSGCADMCLYGDDGEPWDFVDVSTPTARKEHTCDECRCVIAVGEAYERISGKYEGRFETHTACAECAEIRDTFYCDGKLLGQLWEDMSEYMFPEWAAKGPFDCLAKLKTERARDLCRTRFAAWVDRRWKAQQRGDTK